MIITFWTFLFIDKLIVGREILTYSSMLKFKQYIIYKQGYFVDAVHPHLRQHLHQLHYIYY